MRVYQRTRRWWAFLSLAVLPLLVADGVDAQEAPPEIVAVVDRANRAPSLSIHQLRLLYALYQRTWPGGVRVRLILPPPGSAAMEFLVSRVFRHGEERQVDAFYLRAVFGQNIPARPPQLSPAAAIEAARSEPGTIALVERSEIRRSAGIRVLELTDD